MILGNKYIYEIFNDLIVMVFWNEIQWQKIEFGFGVKNMKGEIINLVKLIIAILLNNSENKVFYFWHRSNIIFQCVFTKRTKLQLLFSSTK